MKTLIIATLLAFAATTSFADINNGSISNSDGSFSSITTQTYDNGQHGNAVIYNSDGSSSTLVY
jgi:hypothetical protein